MKFLLTMPAGSEWVLLILAFTMSVIIPICAIYFYAKSKRLVKELERITQEKDMLLAKLLDKAS